MGFGSKSKNEYLRPLFSYAPNFCGGLALIRPASAGAASGVAVVVQKSEPMAFLTGTVPPLECTQTVKISENHNYNRRSNTGLWAVECNSFACLLG